MNLEQILTILSSASVSFVLAVAAFKYDLLKIKANTSSEISKSQQDRIATAERTIDLVDRLRTTMEKQFDEMAIEIQDLKNTVQEYKRKCGTCINNK